MFRPNTSELFPVNLNGNNARILNVYRVSDYIIIHVVYQRIPMHILECCSQNGFVTEVHQKFSSWVNQVRFH